VLVQLAADLGDADDTLVVAGILDTFADGGAGEDQAAPATTRSSEAPATTG
jgi:hypothetical protein